MKQRIVVLVALWILSLVGAASAAVQITQRVLPAGAAPRIFSGADIGFRLDGHGDNDEPRGTLMIRVDGEWKEAGFVMGPRKVR